MESKDMSNLARQKENFKKYAYYDTESLKKTIPSYLNSIKKRIDERACHEEELRIKERNVKERRNDVKRLNEIELQKQESMMNVGTILDDNLDVTKQQGKSSSPGNDTDAEAAKMSKNGSDDDITIAKSSQDKDKTKVQWLNNGLFENDHELEKTNENNKALKEANDLLTKELKTYKEKESQSQFIHDRDIIRNLEQQRDNLQLQNSYQKGHISSVIQEKDTLKANLKHREDKYRNDILQLHAKNKDLENIVCNIGKSTKILRLLTNEQRAYQDNIRKSGLGYKGHCVLSQANAKIHKLYSSYELRDENVQLHVFDSKKTLEDAEKSRLKMKEFQKYEKLLKDRLLEVTLAEDVKNLVINSCVEIGNKSLQDKIERFSKESKDVSNESKMADTFCNDAFDITQELSKRIVDLEKDLSKLEAQSIAIEIAF
ncbi:hypothetical protein Tco_0311817 [Tanacetum coccineum]